MENPSTSGRAGLSQTAADPAPMKAEVALAGKAAGTGLPESVAVVAVAFGALDGKGPSCDSPEEHQGTETKTV